jgi:hypothetical protein
MEDHKTLIKTLDVVQARLGQEKPELIKVFVQPFP